MNRMVEFVQDEQSKELYRDFAVEEIRMYQICKAYVGKENHIDILPHIVDLINQHHYKCATEEIFKTRYISIQSSYWLSKLKNETSELLEYLQSRKEAFQK